MPQARSTSGHGPAITICIVYAVLGALWIFGLDRLLLAITEDAELVSRLQTAKGWFYVLMTTGLLYLVIRFTMSVARHQEQAQRASTDALAHPSAKTGYWIPLTILVGLGLALAAIALLYYQQAIAPGPDTGAPARQAAIWSLATGVLLLIGAGFGILIWWRSHLLAFEARSLQAELVNQADLAERQRAYEALAENSPDMIVRVDRQLRHLYVNRALEAFTGVSRDTFLGKTHAEIGFSGETVSRWEDEFRRVGETGEPSKLRFSFPDQHGRTRHFESLVIPEKNAEGHVEHILSISHDLTDHVKAQEEIRRLRDLYAALSQANQCIIRIDDPYELFQRTCEIVVEYGRLDMAWIGLLDPASQIVSPVSRAGAEVAYLDEIEVSANPARAESHGPVGRAIRQGRASVFEDFLHHPDTRPWQEAAARYGFRAVAAFPLRRGGECIGALAVYSRHMHFFKSDIVQLMEEMASDISFALDNIQREEARQAAEAEMRLAEEVFEHSAESIIITDAAQRILRVNRAFTDRTGYTPDEVVGRRPHMLRSTRHPDHFYRHILSRLHRDGFWEGELWNRRRNGQVYPQWLTLSVVRDGEGDITHYIAVGLDLTETKHREERIRYLAQHDPVTGLPNRGLLADRVDQALHRASQDKHRLALLSLDLDRFKIINESLGHQTGDELLRVVGDRLDQAVGDSGTVCRIGSDQYLVLLPQIERPSEAAQTATDLMTRVAQPFTLAGQEITLSSTVGIAVFPEDGRDREALLSHADAAMSMAKSNTPGGYQFFTADMTERAQRRLSIENRLRRALDQEEFQLHYQPLVGLDDGRITGVEALLRWLPPGGDPVPPAEFIPVAEETSLIIPLGRWVLQEACRQAQAWRDAGLPALPVSVNLSVVQLRRTDITVDVKEALAATGLPAADLHLEITESVFLDGEEHDASIRTFEALQALGVRLVIDDFGTGYSNLGYLKKLPVAKLKIDKTFVRGLGQSANDAAINAAIINMARSLRLRVVAEGVETEAELNALKRLSCDEIQGYLYSHPLPADQAGAVLRDPPVLPGFASRPD